MNHRNQLLATSLVTVLTALGCSTGVGEDGSDGAGAGPSGAGTATGTATGVGTAVGTSTGAPTGDPSGTATGVGTATGAGTATGTATGSGGSTGTGDGMILVNATFEGQVDGTYTEEMVESDFGAAPTWNNGLDEGRAAIVTEAGNKFLRVTYPAGQFGPGNGGVQFEVAIPQPSAGPYQELYLSYKVRFRTGFDFVKGGKLPGLVGGSSPTGCKPSKDGFSARNMWRTGGHAVQYVYHPNQPNTCGDDLDYQAASVNVNFVPGTWHTVVHRIALGTPDANDGVMQAYLDGQLVLDDQARNWKVSSVPYTEVDGISVLYFSTFFGGGDASWAPMAEQVCDFDEFIVSDAMIK